MKMPTRTEGEKCIQLRKRSKRGGGLNQDEHKFCMMMMKKYLEWYSAIETRVFNETVPFGSETHNVEPSLPPYSAEE